MYKDANGSIWYKGNLHTHTTLSDGRATPEACTRMYAEAGYDFLALTDHWICSNGGMYENMLLLSGCEYNAGETAQQGIYHIVGVGMERAPAMDRQMNINCQDIVDGIRAANGIAILAHPAWSLNLPHELCKVRGLSGIEIYNTVSGTPWNVRPYSGGIVDALATHGTALHVMAADDVHFYEGDQTTSYIYVKADTLTRDGILDGIHRGDCYASQGPTCDIGIVNGYAIVRCSPVVEVAFFSDTVYAADRVTRGDGVTAAQYKLRDTDGYVRAELTDHRGKKAWSNILTVKDR